MRIILSPAKKMNCDDSIGIDFTDLPVFLQNAEEIKTWLKGKTFAELKKLWACNDKIELSSDAEYVFLREQRSTKK